MGRLHSKEGLEFLFIFPSLPGQKEKTRKPETIYLAGHSLRLPPACQLVAAISSSAMCEPLDKVEAGNGRASRVADSCDLVLKIMLSLSLR